MDSPAQGSAALIIVNWLYNGINMENLQFPENDGNIMKELFDRANYTKVEVVHNSEDITSDINKFIEELSEESFRLERFHFHYSGMLTVLSLSMSLVLMSIERTAQKDFCFLIFLFEVFAFRQ